MPYILRIPIGTGDGIMVRHGGEGLDIEVDWPPDKGQAVRLVITGPESFRVRTFRQRNAEEGEAPEPMTARP